MNTVPHNALNQHIAVLGKTGSGKTYAAKSIVENLLGVGAQVAIVDPTSAWWGLRLNEKGDGPGFERVLILGGPKGDMPLPAGSGGAVAELITGQGVSVVCDTSDMTVGERTRWFIDFAGTLYRTVRSPLHLVIDEVHNFAPKGRIPDPDAGRMLHACNTLFSGGRSRGIRLIGITQRPQKFHNDSLTSVDTLIAMRVIAPADRDAVKEWIDGAADAKAGKQVLETLASLPRGEGWVWYPEGEHLRRTRFPKINTYDSSATPDSTKPRTSPSLGEIDLEAIKVRMAEAAREFEASDPKHLRKRIAELEAKLEQAGKGVAPCDVDAEIRRETAAALASSMKPVRDAAGELVESLQGMVDNAQTLARMAGALVQLMEGSDSDGANPSRGDLRPVRSGVGRNGTHSSPVDDRRAPSPPQARGGRGVGDGAVHESAGPGPVQRVHQRGGDNTLGAGERRVLIAIAQHAEGVGREQLTVLTGYKRSTRDTYIQRLTAAGLTELVGGMISVTSAGVKALGEDFKPLPTGRRLRDHWCSTLPEGERKVLELLLIRYPGEVPRDEISHATGYKRSTRDTYIQRLATRRLAIVGRDGVKATDTLF